MAVNSWLIRWAVGGLFLLAGAATPFTIMPFTAYGPLVFGYGLFVFLAGLLIVPDVFARFIQPSLPFRFGTFHKLGLIIAFILIAGFFISFSTKNATCKDGTKVSSCSVSRPLYCDSYGKLQEDPAECGCPEGQDLAGGGSLLGISYGGTCAPSKCQDGTWRGSCSSQVPLFCQDGQLVRNESICGCAEASQVYSNVFGCSETTNVSYEELFRHNEQYVGRIVHYRGTVFQVIGYDKDTQELFVDLSRSFLQEPANLYIVGYNGERLLENDKVDVVGEVTGLFTYEPVLGSPKTIPSLRAVNVTRLK